MARITLDRLTKRYGAVTAVDDVSLTLDEGSLTGFVGANGAGKSTTLRMLLGLARPTSASATFDGLPYGALTQPARTVGSLTDPDVFHPGRSGRNALRVLARVSDIPDRRVDEVLELVDLTAAARRRVATVSGVVTARVEGRPLAAGALSEWAAAIGVVAVSAAWAVVATALGMLTRSTALTITPLLLGYAAAIGAVAGISFLSRDPA